MPINCAICGESGVSAAVSRIYEHAKTKQHKVLPCRLCERIFLSGLSLDAHLRGKHGETEPPNQSYYCLICERSFGQEDSFQMHSVTKHYKPVRCAECGESFIDWIKFSAHKKSHRQVEITTSVATNPIDSIQVGWGAEDNSQPAASESPWVTVTRFTGNVSFGTANHTNKGNEETFACKPCNKVFTFKDGMLQHQISTHGQIMKCPEHSCKKSFSQWALYSAHRRDTGHGVDPELRRSDPPIVGSSGFNQLSTLSAIASPFSTSTKNEKIDIPGKFTCPKCSVSHESQNGLDIHIAVHHPELRPRCEICSSTFDLTFRLNEHLDNCPRTCNLCEKKLRNQTALDEHISSHHAASKCETCGEKYDPKTSQKHWDESTAHPHCRICKSGFVDTPELKKVNFFFSLISF
ncbi:hypothetical protein C8Q75DRAFT_762048 [Abortiporus biennis]|nr:hypothetical protein C8Q75DRAFT_762048 [Abortiporus biennis]